MGTPVRLSKLHATGNDFLVLSAHGTDEVVDLSAAQVRAVCDRHRGIGADGLIIMRTGTDGADASMTLLNADGGEAEMSGNGIRALAWCAARDGLAQGDELIVDTGAGRRTLELRRDERDGEVVDATVDMGPVSFDPSAIPVLAESPFGLEATFHGVTYDGDAVGVGNPHLVLFVDDVDTARVVQHGSRLERDERFPNRTNVEFVTPVSRDLLAMRVWERGVGETLSCGTGACAAAAAAAHRGLVGDRVTVRVPGGDLTVELGTTVRLGGPVVHVFDAEVDLAALAADPGAR